MNSDKIKLSVIIPVYNCETYLERCLESVINQTINEIEILCVDDGSTDNSVSIIQEYACSDERIVLLRQKNQGAGIARNKGLQSAKGEYVAFLDADDYYFDVDALSKMVAQCEQNGVYACGSFSLKEENGEILEVKFWGESQDLLCMNIHNYREFQMDYGYVTFIYDRKFLLSNSIYFPSYRRFQDPPFMVRALHKAKYFTMADTHLYCYRVPNMASRYSTEKVTDMIQGIIDNLNYAKDNELNILFERTVDRLEFEYSSVILHNLQENDTGILERLISANTIVQLYSKNNNYVIRPLRHILGAALSASEDYEIYLYKLLEENEKIIVYGAGKFGKAFLRYLREKKQIHKVEYVMISSHIEQNNFLEGVPVISIQDTNNLDLFSHLVFIAAGGLFQKEILKTLKDNGYVNSEALDCVFLSKLDVMTGQE